jgi:hypothetical protein
MSFKRLILFWIIFEGPNFQFFLDLKKRFVVQVSAEAAVSLVLGDATEQIEVTGQFPDFSRVIRQKFWLQKMESLSMLKGTFYGIVTLVLCLFLFY